MEVTGNIVPPNHKLQQLECPGGVDVGGGGDGPAQDGSEAMKLCASKTWALGRLAMAMAVLASFKKPSPTREVVLLKLGRPIRLSEASTLELVLRPPMVEDLGLIQVNGLAASRRADDDLSEPGTGHVWDAAGAVVCSGRVWAGAGDSAAAVVDDCWRTIEDAAGVVLLIARRAAVTRVEDVAVRRALWTACRASIFCF
ncbi:hypothetical protein PspLS_10393 [Pyricularia sp. CBS 133598]|nr:hypothetical protein PspLS_10393 [Pyricularia sp. CBS 133598]